MKIGLPTRCSLVSCNSSASGLDTFRQRNAVVMRARHACGSRGCRRRREPDLFALRRCPLGSRRSPCLWPGGRFCNRAIRNAAAPAEAAPTPSIGQSALKPHPASPIARAPRSQPAPASNKPTMQLSPVSLKIEPMKIGIAHEKTRAQRLHPCSNTNIHRDFGECQSDLKTRSPF